MSSPFAVVVVNYASHQLIKQNLEVARDLRVVVVDNYSTDSERTAISALADERGWTCIHSPNGGFGAGVNLGVAAALASGCRAIVVANPDLELDHPRASELAAAALHRPTDIIAPVVLDSDGKPWSTLGTVDVRAGRLRSNTAPIDQPAWVSGACFAMSAQAWRQLGGFSDDYFMYWEDVDLSMRCQRAGGSVALLPHVRVVHAVGGTQGQRRSSLYYYYNCRNRLVFAAKQLDRRQRVRWLLLSLGDVRRVARRDSSLSRWQRVTTALPHCLRGVIAGSGWMLTHSLDRQVAAG